MSAVRMFFSHSHYNLDDELREWLSHNDVTVTGISMDSNQHGHCLAVLYEPGGGARYESMISFAWRHDELEAQVNEALQAAGEPGAQCGALGSNEHGHCLCIIRRVQ